MIRIDLPWTNLFITFLSKWWLLLSNTTLANPRWILWHPQWPHDRWHHENEQVPTQSSHQATAKSKSRTKKRTAKEEHPPPWKSLGKKLRLWSLLSVMLFLIDGSGMFRLIVKKKNQANLEVTIAFHRRFLNNWPQPTIKRWLILESLDANVCIFNSGMNGNWRHVKSHYSQWSEGLFMPVRCGLSHFNT